MYRRILFGTATSLLLSALVTGHIFAQGKTDPNAPSAANSPGPNQAGNGGEFNVGGSTQGPSWQTNAPIPVANGLSQTTIVSDDGGLIYSIGGGVGPGPDVTINQLWVYDSGSDTWTRLADVLTPIRAFGAAVQLDGRIYVFGGFDGGAPLNTTLIYDIASNTWSRGRDLPGPRFGSAVAVVNGRIFVAGGSSGAETLEYDPKANIFTPRASLPGGRITFRIHASADNDSGQMHVFAGGFDGPQHLIYDVASDSWSDGPALPFGQTDPAVVTAGSTIFVMGGIIGPARTQMFSLLTGTWSQGPALPAPVNNTGGALSGSGESATIFVIGGFSGAASVPSNYSLGVDATVRGGVVRGVVLDAMTGDPIAGATIDVTGPVTRRATSNADGEYRMRVPAGAYTITARAFGYMPDVDRPGEVEEGGLHVENFVLDPAPRRQLTGAVTNGAKKIPVANAEVRVLNTPLAPVMTDDNGNYSIAVPDGTYVVQAGYGRCFGTASRRVRVESDISASFVLYPKLDAFGYSCDDHIQANYLAGDAPLMFPDPDDSSVPVMLPFPFSFYGATYNLIHVSTNGFGNFLGPDATFTNACIPSPGAPNGFVAPLWDDLLVSPPGGVFTGLVGKEPNRQFIIEWRNVFFFGGGGGVASFEALLGEDGSILFQYDRTDGDGNGRLGTVGIENQNGMIGLQFSCNEASLNVGKAILFTR
jgi:N-acetylneuraminic acid mutarotase